MRDLDHNRHSILSLGRLKGLGVEVEEMDREIDPDGMLRQQTQRYVELKLRMARILVNNKNKLKIKGNPYLNVRIDTLKFQNRLFYSSAISLQEDVNLMRDRRRKIYGATTWSVKSVGMIKGLEKIRKIVKEGIDDFIHAYFSINT